MKIGSGTVSPFRAEQGTSLETPGISVFPWTETGMLGNFGVASRVPSIAKSLQSCPTLCDPIDSSPLGSSVPGILQARILEWAKGL